LTTPYVPRGISRAAAHLPRSHRLVRNLAVLVLQREGFRLAVNEQRPEHAISQHDLAAHRQLHRVTCLQNDAFWSTGPWYPCRQLFSRID
jgi:hypothetical protein